MFSFSCFITEFIEEYSCLFGKEDIFLIYFTMGSTLFWFSFYLTDCTFRDILSEVILWYFVWSLVSKERWVGTTYFKSLKSQTTVFLELLTSASWSCTYLIFMFSFLESWLIGDGNHALLVLGFLALSILLGTFQKMLFKGATLNITVFLLKTSLVYVDFLSH